MRHLLPAWCLAVLLTSDAGADPPESLRCDGVADPVAAPPQRVELYTSEGCSSCPPAERWLAGLEATRTGGWLPLAFHVDYWDALGWPDRFADRRYTARQQQVAQQAQAVVYTPGVFIEGVEWRGWRAQQLPPPRSRAGLPTPLALQADVDLAHRRLRWRIDGATTGRPRWVALVQSGLRTEVRAGENAGVELRHDHVVRWLADASTDAQGETTLPTDLDWRVAALVGWLEAAPGGVTLAAVRMPLAACASD
jgi:hypothetical protein